MNNVGIIQKVNSMKWNQKMIALLAVIFCLFHIIGAGTRELPALQQRLVHLTLGLLILFLNKPFLKKDREKGPGPIDFVFLAATVFAGCYLILNYETYINRLGIARPIDIVAGSIIAVLVIEGARRSMGWAMPIISFVALAYAFGGRYLPRQIAHGGFRISRVVSHLSLTTEGIFGVPLGASATVVIIFIMFAAILNGIGAGRYFVDIVMSRLGKARGGSAKATIVGSGLMGMLTGSVIATVMGIGTLTAPLMLEDKYDKKLTASIIAVASTGGQIMPPVMGAAAYIIAEILGLPFINIMKAAIMPAILFYLAAFVYMHLEALKSKREVKTKEAMTEYKNRAQGKHFLILPIVLIVVLMVGFNALPVRSAFYASVLGLVIGFLRKGENRLNLSKIVDICVSTAKGCIEVIVATGCAGVIVGTLSLTGLGFQFSSLIVSLAHGNLILLLLLTMTISLILGMGMTSTACYIILAVLVAPSLISMNVQPIAAHFFVFFFGMYSFLTPPVALGAYAAASLTKADPFKTGYQSFFISIPGFLIPYIFVFAPPLLFIGTIPEIIVITITTTIGITFMSIALLGYFRNSLNIIIRIVIFISGLFLAYPGTVSDIIGIVAGSIALITGSVVLPSRINKEQGV
jgi:TRAP transporter 4TM/12TM fusion protein